MATLPEKATHRQTRTFNRQLVLRAVYDQAQISRAEIARRTGLTRTSVSALISALLEDGLVEEVGRGPSTGGKAPILIRVRPDARHAIGLDLGDTTFSGALVDLRGRVVASARMPVSGRNGIDAVAAVLDLISELLRRNGTSPLLGVGIGAPGVVDSRTGTVRWAVGLDWEQLPLDSLVRERLGVPVVVANDSQAAALAEITYGSVPWRSNLVVIRVARGVGAGIILDGKLHQGDGAGAGEIGHMTLVRAADPAAAQCHCGRSGCLETVASMGAMVAAAKRLAPRIADEDALVDAFHRGDDVARGVVERGAEALGDGIAALISVLNVGQILLIGPATRLGPAWLAAVRRQAERSALPLLARDATIDLGEARENDVVIGASAMLITRELGLSLVR
jgi:N-acetylglucosamine repressor